MEDGRGKQQERRLVCPFAIIKANPRPLGERAGMRDIFIDMERMKQIDNKILDTLSAQAAASPRKRAHYNLHPGPDDPVQRLCIAIEPGTYIRPQRHAVPETWEVFLVLRGSAAVLLFDDAGRVTERVQLAAHGPVHVIEIPSKAWHAIASLETGTVFLEVKQGPYSAPKGAHVAAWAPEEGRPEAATFEAWYRQAKVGDAPPDR
jgi:cupin fold WbuC family metalloprotein